jgi:hypothetical protein
MQQNHQTGNTAVDAVIGFGLSASAYFAPKIMAIVAFAYNGNTVHQVDEVVSTVWHTVGAIIAIVTLGDIVYKKYKAYKTKK